MSDNNQEEVGQEENRKAVSASVLKAMFGGISDIEEFYFPPDIVAGICPRVSGKDEEVVWNAAAEACDSERVSIVWSVAGDKIWYLATKTSDLALHPHSWCPFAAFLPDSGSMGELPCCYTYFSEDLAIMMVVSEDDIHIFRGSTAIVKAKSERIAQEYNKEVKIVNMDPYKIAQMHPVPWYSLSLFEERERRVLAGISVAVGIVITVLSVLIWLAANVYMIAVKRDYKEIAERNEIKMMQFIRTADQARISPLREQLSTFLKIHDSLFAINGQLIVYEIEGGSIRWKAVVPAVASEKITAFGGQFISPSPDGAIIGNDAQVRHEERQRERN